MKTLADEILDALPSLLMARAEGATVEDIANLLCAPPAHVRAAMHVMHDGGRASLARWPGSKRRYLVPLNHDFGGRRRACPVCYVIFKMNQNSAPCCSRPCGAKRSWGRVDEDGRRERVSHLIDRSRTPEARAALSERSKQYYADPEKRAALSERSKAWWADPANAAVHATRLQKVMGEPERRKALSERRKIEWQDPEFREKHVAPHRALAATPEYRRRRAEQSKAMWDNPEVADRMRAISRENIKRAQAAVLGRKQTPEQVRKRVEATQRTRQAKAASQPK